jgi:type II secretory pathway pseudopilin PulG
MDDDIKELTRLLTQSVKPEKTESSVTVGWAVIIGLLAAMLGFLLVGYINNANSITKLQAEVQMQANLLQSMQQTQARIEAMMLDIRVSQAAKQKEVKGNE